MSQEVRELAYSPILWAVTITAISLVLILATFYLVKAVKVSKEMGITQKQLKDAAKTSAIASIGPTIVICVGMISLLVMVGAAYSMDAAFGYRRYYAGTDGGGFFN